ncbi:unnamed protein product [Schistosoma turkestanicum]|nr:unnamed protein product [Schistosoma turkestanicum]
MPVIRQHCRAHNSDANKQRCNNLGPFHFELNDVHNNGAEKNKESLCRSRTAVRLVYKCRLLINTLSWLQMPAALVDSRTLRMVAINEVGSYVMATWRNDFQCLAEVLAHRQRHGTRAEYRIRYIWDRVVEWTPVSKLRKATQYEIDYVLKFCKEQGTLSTNKIPSKFDLQYSCSSSNDSASGTSQAKRIRTNVSESKSIDRTSDPETHRYRSRPTHVSTSGFSVLEDKKTLLPKLFDEIIEQDGMVCDKSVFQFHEACRRRRELKRKAIEENDTCPYRFDSSVSVLSQTFTIRSNHQNRRGLNLKHNSIRTENYAAEATVASSPVSSNSFCQKSDKIKGTITLCGPNEMCKRTLGVERNIRADESFVRVHVFPGNLTRRNILSFIALIFDPGGGIWKHIIKSTRRKPQHGDSPLVNNTSLLRNLWVEAIVREVNYGPDGRFRTIRLKRHRRHQPRYTKPMPNGRGRLFERDGNEVWTW